MRCFGGNSRLGQQRSTASCVITRVIAGSKAGCARLRMPFRQLLKRFRACFGPSTEPPVQVRRGVTEIQAPSSSTDFPTSCAEAILVPIYEGPIANSTNDQPVINSVMSVECFPTNGTQTSDACSSLGRLPAEADSEAVSTETPHVQTPETKPAAAQLVNPQQQADRAAAQLSAVPLHLSMPVLSDSIAPVADASGMCNNQAFLAEALARLCKRVSEEGQGQPEEQQPSHCSQASQQHMSHAALPAAVSKDMPDSQDYQATVAEALARLCKRVSEEGQSQSADQVVTSYSPADKPVTDDSMSPAVAPSLFAVAESSQPACNTQVSSADCQHSADDAADSVADVLTAIVNAVVSSEVQQHAAVDQAVDELLAEVCAALEPMQLSMPAGTTVVKHLVSLPADICTDTESMASLPALPAADSHSVSVITESHTPPGQLPELSRQLGIPSAVSLVMIEQQLPVPSSSSDGKENVPVGEAGLLIKAKEQGHAKPGMSSLARGRQWWHDRTAFQQMAASVPTEPAQACWNKSKLAELGCGPAHQTILALAPTPTSALPIVLRVCTGPSAQESAACINLAKEALLMHLCAHPNVVPITVLGLRAPLSSNTPQDPRRVAYFGMPLADMSLQKRLGQQAWGRSSRVGPAYQGPSLLTLVKYAQAILKALAHTHSRSVLHRGLTPDHVLLYSRAGQEAEGEVRKATKPAAIKHTVRLAGFGAATKLNGQGVALYPSSDRCEPGYVPPEALLHQPLTTAADIYQLGGVCYFMATGCHPPVRPDHMQLSHCMPEEWRLLVCWCRAANPSDRPTVAHLRLHLFTLCQHIKQAPQSTGSSTKLTPAQPVGASSSECRHKLPPMTVTHPTEAAAVEFASVLPRMASNPLYCPVSTPSQMRPTDVQLAPAALAQTLPVAAAATAAWSGVRSHMSWASAALGLGAPSSLPQLMPGVERWLPEDSITCDSPRQGSTPCSHMAAARRQPRVAILDATTAAIGSGRTGMHETRLAAGSSAAAHSRGDASASIGCAFGDKRDGSQAGDAAQQRLSVQPSEASEVLQPVASSHEKPAGPERSLCKLAGLDNTSISTAASGKQMGGVNLSTHSLDSAKIGKSYSRARFIGPSITSQESAEHSSRQQEAARAGKLVSPSTLHTSSGLTHSPDLWLAPRRDDAALEKLRVTGSMAQAQGKAAGLAASVELRAVGLAEQQSALLQPPISGRGSSVGLGSIVGHMLGISEVCL